MSLNVRVFGPVGSTHSWLELHNIQCIKQARKYSYGTPLRLISKNSIWTLYISLMYPPMRGGKMSEIQVDRLWKEMDFK